MLIPEGTPQRMLKSVLLGAPSSSSHRSHRGEVQSSSPEPRGDDGEGTSRSRRGPVPSQTELSASHVLKERRRREKLNEGFAMLRSLVPFVTKVRTACVSKCKTNSRVKATASNSFVLSLLFAPQMDRASILGDTIEYVKQLRRRIQELESRDRLVGSNQKTTMAQPPPPAASTEERGRHQTSGGYLALAAGTGSRAAEASGNSNLGEEPPAAGDTDTEVQVSIIGSDALLELRCPHREGLLLRVMQALHQELRLEITSVQASSAGDVLLAKLRAKVSARHGMEVSWKMQFLRFFFYSLVGRQKTD